MTRESGWIFTFFTVLKNKTKPTKKNWSTYVEELLMHCGDQLFAEETVGNYENFQGLHFFLLSASFQIFAVKEAQNAAKVLSHQAEFKIKINGVCSWQRHEATQSQSPHAKAKWKLILPSLPGVAPDEFGG